MNAPAVAAVVPLKLNSRRLPQKNWLQLGGRPLAAHVFDTLLGINDLVGVYCFASSEQITARLPTGVIHLPREPRLDGDEILGLELLDKAVEALNADVIVLVHATSPFISADSISDGIRAVIERGYDSALSVVAHRTFAWFRDQPLNYDPSHVPQTQNLSPVLLETSGFYIFRRLDYLRTHMRVGRNPYFVEVSAKEAVDIDTLEDLEFASLLVTQDG